jgi:trigger factor
MISVEVTINTTSAVAQKAEIQVSNEELKPVFDRAYEKYRQKAEIRGFRKGKAPLDMIRRMYGEAIEHESLDDAADMFYRKAMEERNIRPLGRPTMTDMDFQPGRHFRFTIEYEVRPAIRLGATKGLLVERPRHTVTDAEVQAEIDHLRRINSTSEPADTVTDENHLVTADIQELDESGSPLIGRKTTGARFLLSDATLAPEIRDALKSAAVDGTYRAQFEDRHEDHTHTVRVALTVTGIERILLPPFDEALVKKVTKDKVTSPEEFTGNVRADLERYWEDQAERKVRDAIADEIVRTHEFDVPESLVNNFLDAFVEDIRNRSKDKALPPGFDDKKFREESRVHAVWQAKWMLLKEAIAAEEGIAVTDAELEKIAEVEAGRIGIDAARLLQYYKSSQAAGERLLSDKVMAFLRQQAKVTDVAEREPATH